MRLTIFSVIFPIFLSIRSNTPLLLKLKIPSSDTITWSESPMPSCLQTASRFAVKRASSELGCALPDGWEWHTATAAALKPKARSTISLTVAETKVGEFCEILTVPSSLLLTSSQSTCISSVTEPFSNADAICGSLSTVHSSLRPILLLRS